MVKLGPLSVTPMEISTYSQNSCYAIHVNFCTQRCIVVNRNMWNVWRTVLEENEKLARARLAAVEVFSQHVVDEAKVLRSHKILNAKKVNKLFQLICFVICNQSQTSL